MEVFGLFMQCLSRISLLEWVLSILSTLFPYYEDFPLVICETLCWYFCNEFCKRVPIFRLIWMIHNLRKSTATITHHSPLWILHMIMLVFWHMVKSDGLVWFQVPNAVGFVLGSAQLILYAVYRNKSRPSATSEERVEEEGSAHAVKRAVEMQVSKDDGKASPKNHSLSKGRSLPMPFISRQYSLQKIMRTLSWSPCELQDPQQDKDIEKGDIWPQPSLEHQELMQHRITLLCSSCNMKL